MVTYIYFVKCPNCEDEHFDFFDDAKEYALGCLSQKPVITQTEVNRNDFGECVDHCDLGTVWSWEDMMKDIEPEDTVFSKAETFGISEDIDFEDASEPVKEADTSSLTPSQLNEFANYLKQISSDWYKRVTVSGITEPTDDFGEDEISASIYWDNNSNAFEFELSVYHSSMDNNFEVGPDGYLTDDYYETYATIEELYNDYPTYLEYLYNEYKSMTTGKPIPEGMTVEELKEAMEENEDTVECAGCEELFPKDECFHKDGIGWVCGNCEDRIVKCTWCDGLYDRGECRKEVDLGWLCDRCEAAIKSRGETLTFREGNYWDFLDESTAVTDSANIGKRVRLIHKDSGYHVDGTEYQLYDLKRLLRVSKIADLSPTSINLIVKFDNSCKIIQETDKGYLLSIPCYFRNQRDRSKIETKPVYVRCWVPKVQVELIEDFREASEDDFFNAFD